jgi:ketosteroid isomerase-like protein
MTSLPPTHGVTRDSDAHDVTRRYFTAMQAGPDGHDALVRLFAPDGVYVEPFSGQSHVGPDEIRAYLTAAGPLAPPDLVLIVEQIDVHGDHVTAMWRCESPAFTTPSRGRDLFLIRDGQILRLETELVQPPTPADRPS